jgi:two-component system C4-dicarboxylate transport response regulator DctD
MSKKKRILIVEDDRDTRAQLGLLVELLGYEAELCADGVEAHNHLEQAHVDLVLTDLVLPRGDGVDLLTEIHAGQPDLPVIILTGYPSEGSIRETLAHEPFAYLTKPISGEHLASVLERAFATQTNKLTERHADS